VAPPPAGSAHLDGRAAQLIACERYVRNATGALVAHPPADIAYRLRAWCRLPVSAGQVAAYLNDPPAGRPLLPLPPGETHRSPQSQLATGSPTGRQLLVPTRVGTAPA
jgi:hypothetical protein